MWNGWAAVDFPNDLCFSYNRNVHHKQQDTAKMGIFERYLSVWVGLCILLGILMGIWFPELFALVASFEVANVNLPVAVLIWVMIYPMMVQIDF